MCIFALSALLPAAAGEDLARLPTHSDVAFVLVDDHGEPLSGVAVRLVAEGEAVVRQRTDARGRVHFVLPSHLYRIEVGSPLYQSTTDVDYLFPGGDRETPKIVRVRVRDHGATVFRIYRRSATSRLPVARSVAATLALTPGLLQRRDGLHVAGSVPAEVEWRLDNLNVTDPVMGGLGLVPAGPQLVPAAIPPLGR